MERETVSEMPAPIGVEPLAPESGDVPRLGLRRGDQLVLGVVIAVALALMAVHWARLGGWGMRPIEIERQPPLVFEHRLDVNVADRLDWTQLPGIGETLADRIVADREANGPFESIDDVRRVKGIGPKTIEALRPWLRVGDDVP
ncbi:MAG: helix-hairpin-helix domain-containing protein [Planctomycetaceae bacterium]